jgi:hypothetical protein
MPTSSESHLAQLEKLARVEFHHLPLSAADRTVLMSAISGEPAYIAVSNDEVPINVAESSAKWGAECEVHADVLRWLCVSHEATKLIAPQGIQVVAARITGSLSLNYVSIPFPIALYWCHLTDPLLLFGAQVIDLSLTGSWTSNIVAESANIKNSLSLDRGFRADGQVSLIGAQIGRNLVCDEGTFIQKDDVAIFADRLKVGGGVFFRADDSSGSGQPPIPFRAEGAIRLHSAQIGGDLDCTGGQFVNRDKRVNRGRTIHLGPAVVKGTIFFRAGYGSQASLSQDKPPQFRSEGIIDLRGASAANLWDDKSGWPERGKLFLDGFVYDRFRTGDPGDTESPCPVDAESRLDWLQRDTTPGLTQPYQQLAKVLQAAGDVNGAKRVLEHMERRLSKSHDSWLVYALKWCIGFGYRPQKAIAGLLFIWFVGMLMFSYGNRVGVMVPSDREAAESLRSTTRLPYYYPQFSAPIFSLENTFPLVRLGQADKWQPNSARRDGMFLRWTIWGQNLLGWLGATLVLAALSGIVRHD